MPRKTDLTPEVQEVIVEALRKGHYAETACGMAGISHVTYYSWINRGREGEEPFLSFLTAIEKAESESLDRAIESLKAEDNVKFASPKDAQWFLERRKPNLWGKNERIKISGDPNAPIKVNIDFSRLTDEQIEELERIATGATSGSEEN